MNYEEAMPDRTTILKIKGIQDHIIVKKAGKGRTLRKES